MKHLLDLSRQSDQGSTTDELRANASTGELAIPDNAPTGVTGTINVPDELAIGSLKVKVEIEHPYVGDLKVVLSQGGTSVTLHDRLGGGNDNLSVTYSPKEFDGTSAKGDWILTVSDLAGSDVGTVKSWTIYVAAADLPLSEVKQFTSTTVTAIPDNDATGIRSKLTIGDTGTLKGLKVSVNVTHPYIGDLTVTLERGAQKQILHSREGGSADNLVKTFTLTSFNGSPLAGEWTLVVTDTARADKGSLNSWTIEAEL